MATKVRKGYVTLSIFMVLLILFSLQPTEAQIGVAYGKLGDNLPSPQQVVNLFRNNGITKMRIYWPDQQTLQALKGSGIQLFLNVPNEDIQGLAQDPSQATRWVQRNVCPYCSIVHYISVGNEVPQWIRQYVGPAMWNIQNALNNVNNLYPSCKKKNINSLADRVKVTTTIGMNLIKNSYPPSAGEFTDLPFIDPILDFLNNNDSPLTVNVYPYFAYIYDKKDIGLDYALFTSPGTVVTDWNNGLQYQNIFDAMVDSVYAALAKRGYHHIKVIVTETGWPSAGGDSSSWKAAHTYYHNVISHAKYGTPLVPGPMDIYLFAMFDENQKQGDATEQHFGLFGPNGEAKYDISFTS
ncbi:glucan endo-1,3-beta-glucosidase-like [Silene latifolia]|uniref:glucan endo-1,3-beta-glucosidase-like n=1 Tax=Silene latifolia TaxID=37657 RepID=UPI003D7870F4